MLISVQEMTEYQKDSTIIYLIYIDLLDYYLDKEIICLTIPTNCKVQPYGATEVWLPIKQSESKHGRKQQMKHPVLLFIHSSNPLCFGTLICQ